MAFRGMLAVMGSTPVREFSALDWNPGRESRPALRRGRHLDASSRHASTKVIGRQGVRAFHATLRDRWPIPRDLPSTGQCAIRPFSPAPLLTIFGERNDPLDCQPRWKELFSDARQVVVTGAITFPCATTRTW